MASIRCPLHRLLRCHPWNAINAGPKLFRQNAWHHIRRSKSSNTKSHRGWLYRLTGLGTGLSICAKPAIVPVDEEKKILNIDPSSLTHSSLIRNAASVAVDAASALVSQSVIAAIELNQQHSKLVYELITLYEQHVINLGVPAEESIWQDIIGVRVKADDARRAAQEVETVLEAALRVLEHAGEAAYQAGAETAALIAGQRVTLARSQLQVAKTVSSNAVQELTKIQEMSITETTKRAEQEEAEQQQQSAETAAA